jgi:hypothetical protein
MRDVHRSLPFVQRQAATLAPVRGCAVSMEGNAEHMSRKPPLIRSSRVSTCRYFSATSRAVACSMRFIARNPMAASSQIFGTADQCGVNRKNVTHPDSPPRIEKVQSLKFSHRYYNTL